MPDFKAGLERLAELSAPPDDALDRLARKRNRMQRNRRIGAALLAFAVAGFGVGAALVALAGSDTEPLPILRIRNGYGIAIPTSPLGYEKKGMAILDAATNLPSGTKVSLYLFSADIETPGQSVVMDGRIPIRIWNGFCHQTERGLEGTTTKVTVVVSPLSSLVAHGGSRIGGTPPPGGLGSPPPFQPPGVRAVLGQYFERLTGDQVIEENGTKRLIASTLIRLPADTCVNKLVYVSGGDFRQVPVNQPVRPPYGPIPSTAIRFLPRYGQHPPGRSGQCGNRRRRGSEVRHGHHESRRSDPRPASGSISSVVPGLEVHGALAPLCGEQRSLW
jgi:hypothetical protein